MEKKPKQQRVTISLTADYKLRMTKDAKCLLRKERNFSEFVRVLYDEWKNGKTTKK